MAVQHNDTQPAIPGAAIYVDTENLREPDLAQDVIAQTVADWPAEYPPVGSLSLYVRADKVALWRMWVEATYPELARRVRGVQHFSREMAKNSADLAITADAIGDLAAGQASYIAVISNDSDFGALFVKVREMASERGWDHSPFLWVTAPAGGGVSPEIERFIPNRFRWNLTNGPPTEPAPIAAASAKTLAPSHASVSKPTQKPAPKTPKASSADDVNPTAETVAEELIRALPIGRFKVAEAQQVIRQHWPKHPHAGAPASFGQYLLNEVWPILERRGVTMPRKTSPRTYEITPAAKASVAPSAKSADRSKTVAKVAPPSNKPAADTASEPSPEQLAAEVAEGISEDVFKAADAQQAIRERWPAHATASYSAQRFGIWFAEHLWPIMEAQGVQIANEKPRRYEMTPDARHRLVSQATY